MLRLSRPPTDMDRATFVSITSGVVDVDECRLGADGAGRLCGGRGGAAGTVTSTVVDWQALMINAMSRTDLMAR